MSRDPFGLGLGWGFGFAAGVDMGVVAPFSAQPAAGGTLWRISEFQRSDGGTANSIWWLRSVPGDFTADVDTAGYFSDLAAHFRVGDLIFCSILGQGAAQGGVFKVADAGEISGSIEFSSTNASDGDTLVMTFADTSTLTFEFLDDPGDLTADVAVQIGGTSTATAGNLKIAILEQIEAGNVPVHGTVGSDPWTLYADAADTVELTSSSTLFDTLVNVGSGSADVVNLSNITTFGGADTD